MPLPPLIEIIPLTAPVRAEITVPGSKSITNRALILAALADGRTTLRGALWSEDTQVMTDCLRALGFTVDVQPDPAESCNRTITVDGLGGRLPRAGTAERPLELFVGNAGTAARFLAAMVSLGDGVYRLSGVPRMHERPQAALFAALRELGYRVDSPNDKLPATIFGKADLPTEEDGRPRIPTKCCTVSVDESSQFASALLLCARTAGWLVTTIGGDSEERPYVRMTEEMVTFFCVCRGQFLVDVDASSASYIWAANHFFEVSFGEQRELPARKDWVLPIPISPDNDWQVDGKFPLCLPLPFELSRSTQLGDSIMTAIVMAPFADHVVRFTDLGRLRVQECERVVALRTELTKCGAKVIEEGDTLTVFPSALHGAEIETYDDHRMAMCFAVLGLKVPGIKLKHPACVKKTFPNFFQKLATPPPHGLGAEIRDAATGRRLAVEELFAD